MESKLSNEQLRRLKDFEISILFKLFHIIEGIIETKLNFLNIFLLKEEHLSIIEEKLFG
jgi:hypothetical protein